MSWSKECSSCISCILVHVGRSYGGGGRSPDPRRGRGGRPSRSRSRSKLWEEEWFGCGGSDELYPHLVPRLFVPLPGRSRSPRDRPPLNNRRRSGAPYTARPPYPTAYPPPFAFNPRGSGPLLASPLVPGQGPLFPSSAAQGGPLVAQRPLDPFAQLLSYKDFLVSQCDDSTTPEQAQHAYDKYKKDYERRTRREFFERHRGEEWFQTRYDVKGIVERREKRLQSYPQYQQRFVEQVRQALQGSTAEQQLVHLNTDVQETEQKDTAGQRSDEKAVEYLDNCLIIPAVPVRVSRQALEQVFSADPDFVHLLLSPPQQHHHYLRTAFLFFTSQAACRRALEKYNYQKVSPDTSQSFEVRLRALHHRPVTVTVSVQTVQQDERVQKDVEQCTALVRKLDSERGVNENVVVDELLDTLSSPLQQLNILLAYLHSVHHYSYYTHTEHRDWEEQWQQCGAWVARTDASQDAAAVTAFFAGLDGAVTARLNVATAPVAELERAALAAQQKLTAAVERYCADQTQQKAEGKFKCVLCTKLFKSADFVAKHIGNKHSAEVEQVERKVRDEVAYALYEADSQRLTELGEQSFTTTGRKPRTVLLPHRAVTTVPSSSRGYDHGNSGVDDMAVAAELNERSDDEHMDGVNEAQERNREWTSRQPVGAAGVPLIIPGSAAPFRPPPPAFYPFPAVPPHPHRLPPALAQQIHSRGAPTGGRPGRVHVPEDSAGPRRLRNYSDLDALEEDTFVPEYGLLLTRPEEVVPNYGTIDEWKTKSGRDVKELAKPVVAPAKVFTQETKFS